MQIADKQIMIAIYFYSAVLPPLVRKHPLLFSIVIMWFRCWFVGATGYR